MMYALVLEKDSGLCNDTSDFLSSMGYLITPVFSPKKALHAAHMIQFDVIVCCTNVNPDDRRCLTGELKRCSPDAIVVLLAEPGSPPEGEASLDGVNAILYRPITVQSLEGVVKLSPDVCGVPPSPLKFGAERRRRAID